MARRESAYSRKLRDPRWQRVRLKALEVHGWRCLDCGSESKTLHVHHLFYESGREPWEYDPERDLVSLCEDCHEARTAALVVLHRALSHQDAEDLCAIAELCNFGIGAAGALKEIIEELWAETDAAIAKSRGN